MEHWRKSWSAVAIGAILAVGCMQTATARAVRPANTGIRYSSPLRVLHLHGDTSFSDAEKAQITEATDNLFVQTSGMLKVDVVYDFDFGTTALKEHGRDNLLIRAPEDAPHVKFQDSNAHSLLGIVCGIDLANFDRDGQKRIYIVPDRFVSHNVFVHVVMHEVLHAFGLGHVSDPSSVMAASVGSKHPVTCINLSDAQELCRVEACRPQDLNFCE